jgi:putative spermidine/putrescine transport system ATP-binding protein
VREELRRLQRRLDISFIHVTHSQDEALALADLVIVMNGGRIEQAAPPRTIFDAPRTTFVARFIGGHNLFPCTVEAADGRGARLRGPCGKVMAAPQGGLEPGQQVVATVRSDRLRLELAAHAKEAGLSATVTGIEYQGTTIKLRLESDWGEPMNALVLDDLFRQAPIAEGEAVSVGWDDADVHLIH